MQNLDIDLGIEDHLGNETRKLDLHGEGLRSGVWCAVGLETLE
jgi:hypothetical protein